VKITRVGSRGNTNKGGELDGVMEGGDNEG